MQAEGYDVSSLWTKIELISVKTVFAILPDLKVAYRDEIPPNKEGPQCFQILGNLAGFNQNQTEKILQEWKKPSMPFLNKCVAPNLYFVLSAFVVVPFLLPKTGYLFSNGPVYVVRFWHLDRREFWATFTGSERESKSKSGPRDWDRRRWGDSGTSCPQSPRIPTGAQSCRRRDQETSSARVTLTCVSYVTQTQDTVSTVGYYF